MPFTSSAPYDCYIMPEDRVSGLAAIIAVLDGTQEIFEAEAFNFSHPDIDKALERAKARGVLVDIIEDKVQAASKSEIVADAEVVPIIGADHMTETESELGHFMHLKTAQSDGKIVIEGSTNWSQTAWLEDQTLLIIRDPVFAASIHAKHTALKAFALSNQHRTA
jgi:phosphatidylserine/phosphatidylglycerophosphate/cardiolipin synthase-like enzyme